MASKKGLGLTIGILATITIASFVIWYVPQNNPITFTITDFEGHLDSVKSIHGAVETSLEEEFQLLRSGELGPDEYIQSADAATAQISGEIAQMLGTQPTDDWLDSYGAYIEALRSYNSYIRETIVYAKLVDGGSSENDLASSIANAMQYKERAEMAAALSDEQRP